MKVPYEIRHYQGEHTIAKIMYLTGVPFSVRMYYSIRPQACNYTVCYWDHTHELDDGSTITNMSEEELFQASCVEEYDVYLVKAAIFELQRQTRLGTCSIESILEY